MLLANKFSISELKSKSNERKSPRMHPYTYSIFMELLVWHVTENGYYFLLKTLRKIYLRCELCLLCEMSVDVCVCMHAHRFFEWDFQLRSHFVDKMTREKDNKNISSTTREEIKIAIVNDISTSQLQVVNCAHTRTQLITRCENKNFLIRIKTNPKY